MSKYKLLKWYPSLPLTWKTEKEIVVRHDGATGKYNRLIAGQIYFSLNPEEVEDFPEFWEKVPERKPLFVTEDGVEIFEGDTFWSVNLDTFYLGSTSAYKESPLERFRHMLKFFYTKDAAEKYVHENKPVFSRKQIRKAMKKSINIGTYGMVDAEQLCKELGL